MPTKTKNTKSKKSVTTRKAVPVKKTAAKKKTTASSQMADPSVQKSMINILRVRNGEITTEKKAATTQIPTWSVIHVFGHGESQVMGKTSNGKVANAELKTLSSLYASLEKKLQKGKHVSLEGIYALNIFNGMFVDVRMRGGKGNKRWAWADVDENAINKFANELLDKSKSKTDKTKKSKPQPRARK